MAAPGAPRFYPQLDGLRALAVLLVLVQHYAPPSPWLARVGPGGLGVALFFVLSGFLLTGILLDVRPAEESASWRARWAVLRVFYLRRYLRIAPLYYLVLALAAFAGVASLRSTWPWHAAYLSNVYFALRQRWEGPLTPLWSLSVEEQFYAPWPLLAVALSPRALTAAALALVVAGPVARWTYYVTLGPSSFWLLLPLGYTDLLAMGALLALCWRRPALARLRRGLVRAGLYVGAPALVLVALAPPAAEGSARWVLLRGLHGTLTALAALALVHLAARGRTGALGRAVLTSAPLRYVGKVSYGVYLQHAFVAHLALGLGRVPGLRALRPALEAWAARPWAWFPVAVATVLLTATASWVLFERPLNERKRGLAYPRASTRDSARGGDGVEPAA